MSIAVSIPNSVSMPAVRATAAPEGFAPFQVGNGQDFLGLTGPFFAQVAEDGHLHLGFRIAARHCNVAGICHGGMLLTFADIQMAIAGKYQSKLPGFQPTVGLSSDFLGAAPMHAWLEGRTEVVQVADGLLFTQCVLRADGVPVLRASATFKLARPDPKMDALLELKL